MVQDAPPALGLSAGHTRRTHRRSPAAPPHWRERGLAYLFISPWALGFIAFTAGPMVVSLITSFTDYHVINPGSTHWVGLANYRSALHDSVLAHSLLVTVLYVALAVPADLVMGLALALVLNTRAPGMFWFRTAFVLPVMIAGTGGASVATALLWLWLFQPARFGLLNELLSVVHLPPQSWVYSTRLVIPSLALMSLWGVGRSLLIYLAALQGLPREVLWAAQVDGARAWRRFWRITLPLISPAILFNLVLDLINALQTFTPADLVTGGGPRDASLVYMLYLYRNAFTYFHMGYASALAWILFGFTLVISLVIFRSAKGWVFYQGAGLGPATGGSSR